MAKTKISEFSATPGNNTDIDGINIAEGCAPSGINDAIRELMSQLKDFQAGTAGDSFNGPVGTTTAAAGAFTTLTTSSTVTLSGGTANGVAYLNGSKVLTTGSALTFDGSTFTVPSDVASPGSPILYSYNGGTAGTVRAGIQLVGTDPSIRSYISGSEQMRLTSTGLGIGTSSPSFRLTIVGASGGGGTVASFSPFTGTDPALLKFNNAGSGDFFIGKDNSAGSAFGSGSAYAANLYNGANTPMLFWTNATKQMTLDASGNLGLGVTPSAWGVYKAADINTRGLGLAGGDQSYAITCNAYYDGSTWRYKGTSSYRVTRLDSFDGAYVFYTAPSGTAGNAISFTQAMTLDASGNLAIGLTSAGARLDASIDNPTRGIVQRIRNGASSTQTGSQLQFTQNGVADWVIGQPAGTDAFAFWSGRNPNADGSERMRIDSSGNLLVGATSIASPITSGGSGVVLRPSGQIYARDTYLNVDADGTIMQFRRSGTAVGSISVTTTATTYNTSSDYRLKNITGPVTNSGAYIDSLNPVEGTWKADGSTFVGLIAHEVQEASRTTVVTGKKDGDEMQAMDYSSSEIIANMIAEIQSLRARVAQLESN